MDYRNKLVLAPMVRVGTLPFRLLAAQYGADITYGEEIIDHKLLKCERRINDVIGSTDIVEKGTENVVFRTCGEERNRVVFQMGTSDAVRALTAAQLVKMLWLSKWGEQGRSFRVIEKIERTLEKRKREDSASEIKMIRKTMSAGLVLLDLAHGLLSGLSFWPVPLRHIMIVKVSDPLMSIDSNCQRVQFVSLCKDVAAIDVNMGCPKAFSISGGMGAALLSKPELIHDILTMLKRNLWIPVTCKIRLLNSTHDSVELARRIEKTGVSAVAVHGRRVADRPRDPANWSEIATVVDALSIPVIANGDVFEFEDFQHIRSVTGASSVMIARGALWNASIFHPEGTPVEDVKREYVRKSILWDHDIKSTKYTLKEMIMHYTSLELPEGKAVTKSESLADIAYMIIRHIFVEPYLKRYDRETMPRILVHWVHQKVKVYLFVHAMLVLDVIFILPFIPKRR
ncbi:Aldolase-type TIM barrel [Cynara cardunculus var. scolymus]|uniref:Aldolase-type TIM barrel n=1 Tax=Cynara cardunculus var. scolymus TaxID=59895 RepID=A0A103YGW2_CYNCS|nr:Aldolase-type TIM barrel [Cynara cardunculus var. scolymus]